MPILSKLLKSAGIKCNPIYVTQWVEVHPDGRKTPHKLPGFYPRWNVPEKWVNPSFQAYVHRLPQLQKGVRVTKQHVERDAILIPTGPHVNGLMVIDIDCPLLIKHCIANGIDPWALGQCRSIRKKYPHIYMKLPPQDHPDYDLYARSHVLRDVHGVIRGSNGALGDFKSGTSNGTRCDGIIERNIRMGSFIPHEFNEEIMNYFKGFFAEKPPVTDIDQVLDTDMSLTPELEYFTREIIALFPASVALAECDWSAVGAMFKHVFGEAGFDLWVAFSQRCPEKCPDENALWDKWRTIRPKNTGFGKFLALAKTHAPKTLFRALVKQYHFQTVATGFLPTRTGEYSALTTTRYFENIPHNPKYILLDGLMGGGKTTALRKRLAGVKRVYIITPRRTLAYALAHSLGAVLYTDTKHPATELRLAIQLESIHKLEDIDYNGDYVVILDEVSSLLAQFNSDTMDTDRRIKAYETFEALVYNATQVICADAFVTPEIRKVLDKLVESDQSTDQDTPFTIRNPHEYPPRRLTVLKSPTTGKRSDRLSAADVLSWGKKILHKALVTDHKRVYIFCSSKKILHQIHGYLQHLHIPGHIYHADCGDEMKADFKDVNTAWANPECRFILTTSTAMIGINYDNPSAPFDLGVYFGCAYGSSPRDTMQALYRVRHFADAEVIICSRAGSKNGGYISRKALESNFEYIQNYTGIQSIDIPDWRIENVYQSILESGISGYHYSEMIKAYFAYAGYTTVITP